MNYYWFNRQEILLEAKERYSKEKAAKYYAQNKEAIKEKLHCKDLSQEEKDKIKDYQSKKFQELVQYKKETLKSKYIFCSLLSIKKCLKEH